MALAGHSMGVCATAFSPDGRRVVTGSFDRTARIWDTRSGRQLLVLKSHRSYMSEAAGTGILILAKDADRLPRRTSSCTQSARKGLMRRSRRRCHSYRGGIGAGPNALRTAESAILGPHTESGDGYDGCDDEMHRRFGLTPSRGESNAGEQAGGSDCRGHPGRPAPAAQAAVYWEEITESRRNHPRPRWAR